MQNENKILDDLSKLATGAVGVLQGLRSEIEEVVRQQIDKIVERMDLVSREEFEATKEMAALARQQNEELAERVSALEAQNSAKDSNG